eukprot:339183_1
MQTRNTYIPTMSMHNDKPTTSSHFTGVRNKTLGIITRRRGTRRQYNAHHYYLQSMICDERKATQYDNYYEQENRGNFKIMNPILESMITKALYNLKEELSFRLATCVSDPGCEEVIQNIMN